MLDLNEMEIVLMDLLRKVFNLEKKGRLNYQIFKDVGLSCRKPHVGGEVRFPLRLL